MAKISTDSKRIKEILNRGVEDVIIKENLEKDLKSGKQLRVKLGFDPTGEKIHIGRAIILHKLKAFQDLGHKVIFLVGDFTAQVGDPSDKLEKRPMLSSTQIKKNLKTYKEQVGKIIDLEKAEFVFNSAWLKKLNAQELSELAESFTVQQMIARRNFKRRWDKDQEISVRELLYPLFQGYDSVQLKADVEIGGFDQLFNLKAGRVVQKYYGQKPQNILTIQMLEGTDGRKMSTSWGNVINIIDEPNDMFGKVMSLRDDLIIKYFHLCTDIDESEIKKIEKKLKKSNPRDIKLELAKKIVSLYHGEKEANKAQKEWEKVFSKGDTPQDIKEISEKGSISPVEFLVKNKLTESKSMARRLITQGGVRVDDKKILEPDEKIKFKGGEIIKIGKKKFVKITKK